MKALVITTKDIAYVHDFAPPMSESIEKFIGDWTETVRPRGIPGYLMLVDESGLLKHLPCNLAGSLLYGTQFHGSPIVGNIVIAKDDGQKCPQPLTDEEISSIFQDINMLARPFGKRIRWEDEQ